MVLYFVAMAGQTIKYSFRQKFRAKKKKKNPEATERVLLIFIELVLPNWLVCELPEYSNTNKIK